MATVSYGVMIKNRSHAFDKTLEIYRAAVFYHKIGRIPPFLVGGGMNATITIHRQM